MDAPGGPERTRGHAVAPPPGELALGVDPTHPVAHPINPVFFLSNSHQSTWYRSHSAHARQHRSDTGIPHVAPGHRRTAVADRALRQAARVRTARAVSQGRREGTRGP